MADMDSKQATLLITTILIVGLTLIIGILIISTIQTNVRTTGVAGTIANETLARPLTAQSLAAGTTYLDGSCGALTSVLNLTGTNAIVLANFTQTGCSIVLANTSSMEEFSHASYRFSYTYTYSQNTIASDSAGAIVDALGVGPSWLSIILVCFFAVIVLGWLSSGLNSATNKGSTY